MRRHFASFAAIAAIFTLVACDVADDTWTQDEGIVSMVGENGLLQRDLDLDGSDDYLEISGATVRMGEVQLNAGEAIVRSITEGTMDKFIFHTDVNYKYDVIIEPVSGDPDLFTNLSEGVSPSDYDCTSQEDEGEQDYCTVSGGTSGSYYALVEGVTDTVYVALLVESPTNCHSQGAGQIICSDLCTCGLYEGTCSVDEDCSEGLSCTDSLCSY